LAVLITRALVREKEFAMISRFASRRTALAAFLATTLVLFLALCWKLGLFSGQGSNRYFVSLRDASGLVADNSVKVAGVSVGRIAAIRVVNRQAQLELSLNSDLHLHQGAQAWVRSKSLLGEKYLELDPGPDEAALIAQDSHLPEGKGSFDIDELLNAVEPFFAADVADPPADGGEASTGNRQVARALLLVQAALDWLSQRENKDRLAQDFAAVETLVRESAASATLLRQMLERQMPVIERDLARVDHLLHDPRVDRLLARIDRLGAALDRELPPILSATNEGAQAMAKLGARFETSIDEARLAKWTRGVDAMVEEIEGMRGLSKNANALLSDFAQVAKIFNNEAVRSGSLGRDVIALISSLRRLGESLAKVDELTIRRFLQSEGVRVNLGEPRRVRRRIDDLQQGN
jgi:hypothetical protein